MNNIRKFYKEFFGLREQAEKEGSISVKDPAKAEELAKKGLDVKLVDEAQLVNNLTDYRGGIEYVVRDPQTAQSVLDEIRQWSEKKGFTIIKSMVSKTGRIGYIYYRLGEDPALESQKLQGYLAQKPELKHFRFKVRTEKSPTQAPTQAPTRNPQRNI
jgi:hypothetical protein